jgi:hypothetical protein
MFILKTSSSVELQNIVSAKSLISCMIRIDNFVFCK